MSPQSLSTVIKFTKLGKKTIPCRFTSIDQPTNPAAHFVLMVLTHFKSWLIRHCACARSVIKPCVARYQLLTWEKQITQRWNVAIWKSTDLPVMRKQKKGYMKKPQALVQI